MQIIVMKSVCVCVMCVCYMCVLCVNMLFVCLRVTEWS